eukprot:scaffold193635_cov30-Tisochrysis_lutea.AAC.2
MRPSRRESPLAAGAPRVGACAPSLPLSPSLCLSRDGRMARGQLSLLLALLINSARGLAPRALPPQGARLQLQMVETAPRGFIGLGIMGQGMARCLLRAGYPLHVWTRNPDVAASLKESGLGHVQVAECPADVVRSADVTFLMLSTPEVCKEIYTMQGGVLESVAQGKSIVDCATLRPEDMRFLESEVKSRGGRFIEAPVSGSKGTPPRPLAGCTRASPACSAVTRALSACCAHGVDPPLVSWRRTR